MTQPNLWTNPGRPLQLLVVEDEPKLAVLVCRYLDAAGFQTGILADGRLVVNAVRTNPPDLVLLDLMLPGRDGIDICREIRTFSSVPIIMMTARVEEIDRLLGLELGADDYICKPFSPPRNGGPRAGRAAPHPVRRHQAAAVRRGRGRAGKAG